MQQFILTDYSNLLAMKSKEAAIGAAFNGRTWCWW